MEKKITKRDNFNEIIKIATEIGRTDLVEFATHEIELLDKKKASDTKTKNQVENEGIKNTIIQTLGTLDKLSSIPEIQSANKELGELSNQKMSSLLTQLVNSEILVKEYVKKKAYFKLND